MSKTLTVAVVVVALVTITWSQSVELEFSNKENETILVALETVPGNERILGFPLEPGKSKTITVPSKWFGYIWGRTHCNLTTNRCSTGDCDDGLDCTENSGTPPYLYAIFSNNDGFQRYDIATSRGINIPMGIEIEDTTGRGDGIDEYNCTPTKCKQRLDDTCPEEYRIYKDQTLVGCTNPCAVFDTDDFCCRGRYKDSTICQSVAMPEDFEYFMYSRCPDSVLQFYENAKFSCRAKKYIITFGL